MFLQEGVFQQLRCLFTMRASRWGDRYPSEGEKLAGEILKRAASVDVGELIVDQIQRIAWRNRISPELVVERAFIAFTAAGVLLYLQLA